MKSLRIIVRRVVSILEMPLIYLFGRDIFISYARSDAANYAQQLGIAVREVEPKFSFYLDQWASLSGTTLPLSLKMALRWSQLLVFIGTEKAIASKHVRSELQVFFNKKGRFVPIDVDGALDQAMRKDEFMAAICGPGAVREEGKNISASKPSEDVVTRVVNAATFTRQDRRLRRAVAATTIGVLTVIATAHVVSQSIVVDAQSKRDEALIAADDARKKQTEALNEADRAKTAASRAAEDEKQARMLAQQANEEAKLAEEKRIGAERLRDQARAEAGRQSEIATLRQRANQSELTLRQSPTRLADSVSLAVESMNRADAIGINSLEADRALRASLSLMPRSLGPPRTIEGAISTSALSPDGKYVAVSTGSSSRVLQIRSVADGNVIAEIPCEDEIIALSNDARRVSVSDGSVVQTRDISGSGKWELEFPDRIMSMSLSPNGRYLALAMQHSDIEKNENRGTPQENETFAEVWDIESGKLVTRLQIGFLKLTSIAFSQNGHFLAAGGDGEGSGGVRMGRVLVWDFRGRTPQGVLTAESFRTPDELLQDGRISEIAPGPDDRYLATANLELAIVWKKSLRSGYQEVARIPLEGISRGLAFNADGNRLTMLSQRRCPTASGDCSGLTFHETWEPVGWEDAVTLPHTSTIKALSFQPGDQLITTLSGYDTDQLRVWNANDGQEIQDVKLPFDEDARTAFFTSDVRYVVTTDQNTWSVLDVLTQKKVSVNLGVEFQRIGKTALSADGMLLALSGRKKGESYESVLIYKRGSSAYVMVHALPLAAHPTSMAITSDSKYLVTAPYEKGMQIFELKSGKNITPANLVTVSKIRSFEIAPDGKHLAIFFQDEQAMPVIWRLGDFREVATLRRAGRVSSNNFKFLSDELLGSPVGNTFELVNVKTGQRRTLTIGNTVKVAALRSDGRLLAVADDTGLVTVFEVSTGGEIAHLQHEGAVTNIAFSNDGKYLATSTRAETDRARPDEDHVLHVWLLRPRDLIREACQRLTRFRADQLSYCASR